MPLKPIDFSKTIIYKIWKDDDFYVGSTIDFPSRKSKHKHTCNNEKHKDYKTKLYQTIREKGGWEEWEMSPLEEYVDCKSKTQARIREEEWRVKLNASLNMNKAFIAETIQEYKKQNYRENIDKYLNYAKEYRQEHAEELKTYFNQHYQEHKDEINTKKAERFECVCGSVCRIGDKARHEKTLKHRKYLEKE
jgi:hypothetical protein